MVGGYLTIGVFQEPSKRLLEKAYTNDKPTRKLNLADKCGFDQIHKVACSSVSLSKSHKTTTKYTDRFTLCKPVGILVSNNFFEALMDLGNRILHAALGVFYQHGFHATGVEQLSAAAGVTKKTLYRHFASKDLLISAVLRMRDQIFMDLMDDFVSGMDLPTRPSAYIGFLERWVQEETFNGCMFINATSEYGRPTDLPHIQAKDHKENVINYLNAVCYDANIPDSARFAHKLFLIGEGLIVDAQVRGYQKQSFDLAYELLGFSRSW